MEGNITRLVVVCKPCRIIISVDESKICARINRHTLDCHRLILPHYWKIY